MNKRFDDMFPTRNRVDATGALKTTPEDFKVFEQSEIAFSGSGEHLWLWIEKTDTNTDWLAKQLALACEVPNRQVGYAGLKDRHAVTRQWFSVQLPQIKDPSLIQQQLPQEVTILDHQWHHRKIKTGQLQGNQFVIRIHDVKGDLSTIDSNIKTIAQSGVPNYFGPQRFGHDMGNIEKAERLMQGKFKTRNKKLKSLLMSTARSHIFNAIVAERMANELWDQSISGDIVQLNQSQSWFQAVEEAPDSLEKRLQQGDVHLTAALWGEDPVQSSGQCAELEMRVAAEFTAYEPGFERFRLKQDRRAIRLMPKSLRHQWKNNDLLLSFELPAGAYATSVMREIVCCT